MRHNIHKNSQRIYYVILLALTCFFIFHSIVINPALPDFESYRAIYEFGGEGFTWKGATAFTGLITVCHRLGVDYIWFRIILKFLSVVILIIALRLILKRVIKEGFIIYKCRADSLLVFLLVFFATYLFAFEFYEIQIRAGLAISFALLSFALFMSGPRKLKLIYKLCAILAAIIALGTHEWTSLVLLYVLFLPMLLARIYRFIEKRISFESHTMFMMFVSMLLILSSLFILYKISTIATLVRGEHLFSPLNPIRFAFFSIFTILYGLFTLPFLTLRVVNYHLTSPDQSDKSFNKYRLPLPFVDKFKMFLFMNYFAFAISLAVFYALDILHGSGEAIVRVYTLFTPAFLIGTLFQDKIVSRFFLLILVGNGLFFLNTVFF